MDAAGPLRAGPDGSIWEAWLPRLSGPSWLCRKRQGLALCPCGGRGLGLPWAGHRVISLHWAPALPSAQLCSVHLPPRCLSLIGTQESPGAVCVASAGGSEGGHVPVRWHALIRWWPGPRCPQGSADSGAAPCLEGPSGSSGSLPPWVHLPGPSAPGFFQQTRISWHALPAHALARLGLWLRSLQLKGAVAQ